jgi:uncharacterized protein
MNRGPSAPWLALAALALAASLWASAFGSGAALGQAGVPSFPALSGRVVDAANILSPEAEARISARLAAHEAASTDQIAVATVPDLGGRSIEEYANGLHRHWALGRKERSNGALLLVAPAERRVRIEVGYGLEGALTDALTRTIVTTAIAPRFRSGDFSGGVEAGVDAMLDILKGDAQQWGRQPILRDDGPQGWTPLLLFAFFLFVMIVVMLQSRAGPRSGSRAHRTRSGRWIVLPGPSGGWSGGNGGFSGDGFSGGGFSGGGGSSGGGGASGDW